MLNPECERKIGGFASKRSQSDEKFAINDPSSLKNKSTAGHDKYHLSGNERRKRDEIAQAKLRKDLTFIPFLVWAVPPFFITLYLSHKSSGRWQQVILLMMWYSLPILTAWLSPPMASIRGIVLMTVNLVGGVFIVRSFDLPDSVKSVYLGATLFFLFGRGNTLLCQDIIRHSSFAYKLAYVLAFHDFARCRYCNDLEEYEKEKNRIMLQFIKGGLRCSISLLLLFFFGSMRYPTIFTAPIEAYVSMIAFTSFMDICCAMYRFAPLVVSSQCKRALIMTPLTNKCFESKSLHEFWSKRWDTGIQPILYYNGYIPTRSLGFSKQAAAFNTFVLSGFLHYLFFMELGGTQSQCLCIFFFFVMQPILLFAEPALRKNLGWSQRGVFLFAEYFTALPFFYYPLGKIIQASQITTKTWIEQMTEMTGLDNRT